MVSIYHYVGQIHRFSAAEVVLRKHFGTGELVPLRMLSARVITWVVDESDWLVIAGAVAHLRLPLRLDEAAPSMPSAPLGVFYDVLAEDSCGR